MKYDYDAIIIGAGLAGIGMAATLQERKLSFLVLERAQSVGGTWRDNTYPGCGCDVPSHLYWYSFDSTPPEWSRIYARQPEILAGIEAFVERRGIGSHIQFSTEVTALTWSDVDGYWIVQTNSDDFFTARAVISAVGQLSTPSYRGIRGREIFTGDVVHSAAWDADIDLTGKRVACIGSGASAAQVIPELVKTAAELIVFQRSAPYVLPRLDRKYTDEELASFREAPELLKASRAAYYAWREEQFLALDPENEVAKETEKVALDNLNAQIKDPELRRKLTPDYPFGCKRPVISDDLLRALAATNTVLVMEEVTEITPIGPVDTSGHTHEVDVIVFATGFESNKFLNGITVRGRNGKNLHKDAWNPDPEAYLGMSVSGFPNFFALYGPNTNLNHNSIIAMLEVQYGYVADALDATVPGIGLDLRPEVLKTYNDELQQKLSHSVFTGGCTSWYQNSTGRVIANWWGSVDDYRDRASRFDDSLYEEVTSTDSIFT